VNSPNTMMTKLRDCHFLSLVLFILPLAATALPRLTLRLIQRQYSQQASSGPGKKVLITGAGNAGELAGREFKKDNGQQRTPMGHNNDEVIMCTRTKIMRTKVYLHRLGFLLLVCLFAVMLSPATLFAQEPVPIVDKQDLNLSTIETSSPFPVDPRWIDAIEESCGIAGTAVPQGGVIRVNLQRNGELLLNIPAIAYTLDFGDGRPIPHYCVEVEKPVAIGGDYCSLDERAYGWEAAWVLVNYPPILVDPEGCVELTCRANVQFAARQSAFWFLVDGWALIESDPTTSGATIDAAVLEVYRSILAELPAEAPSEFLIGEVELTLSPEDATNSLPGSPDHTITATVTKGGGPLSGQEIKLTTDFGSLAQDRVTTDENGEATFVISSDTAGTATITAGLSSVLTTTVAYGYRDNVEGFQKIARTRLITITAEAQAQKRWVQLAPDLSLSKTLVREGAAADGIVRVDQPVSYTIAITNTGATALATVPLVDTYDPTYLQFVNADPEPDQTAAGTLTWNDLTGDGFLAPGESLRVVIRFRAIASTANQPEQQTINVAVVEGAQDEQGQTVPPQEDVAPVRITNPQVGIVKTVAAPVDGLVRVGEHVTFTIQIENLGDTTLVTIPVRDLYEAQFLEFSSTEISIPQVTVEGNEGELFWPDITNDLGNLAPNQSVQFNVSFLVTAVTSNTTNIALLQNVIDEFGDNVPPVQGQDSASVVAEEPTAVLLLSFTATRIANAVQIRWVTGWEQNSWGFHLWRSQTNARANAVRITPTLIPAQGANGGGAQYSFLDGSAEAGIGYRYWLEEIEIDGQRHEYGPVQQTGVQVQTQGNWIYLPILSRSR
jgi:uncharacterized repeat protein (TIGR01451 family)